MKKVLIISSDYPYPANHGGRVDVFEKICSLKKMGYKVYLLSTVKYTPDAKDVEFMNSMLEMNILLDRNKSLLSLFSLLPYQISSRKNNFQLSRAVETFKNIKFDYCIVEGHYCLEVFNRLKRDIIFNKKFLRFHNDEIKYFRELSQSSNNLLKKLFFRIESFKFLLFERLFIEQFGFNKFLHISIDECKKYEILYPNKNTFLPASLNVDKIIPYKEKINNNVLFLGSLFMPNNIESLIWYLENIHDKLCNKYDDYLLMIAGNTRGMDLLKFKKYLSKFQRIDFIDTPKTTNFLYNESTIFINPMLSGAGVKLKTINAIQNGLPIVSTSIGNEGTGFINGKDILIADTPDDYYQYICLLLEDKVKRAELVKNAQKFIKECYDQEKNLLEIFK